MSLTILLSPNVLATKKSYSFCTLLCFFCLFYIFNIFKIQLHHSCFEQNWYWKKWNTKQHDIVVPRSIIIINNSCWYLSLVACCCWCSLCPFWRPVPQHLATPYLARSGLRRWIGYCDPAPVVPLHSRQRRRSGHSLPPALWPCARPHRRLVHHCSPSCCSPCRHAVPCCWLCRCWI